MDRYRRQVRREKNGWTNEFDAFDVARRRRMKREREGGFKISALVLIGEKQRQNSVENHTLVVCVW